jgi:UDP-glucose 4-epimerase
MSSPIIRATQLPPNTMLWSEGSSMPTLPEESERVLVTGGTGVLGPGVVRALAAAGYRVRVMSRTQPKPELLPPTIETVRGDVADATDVEAALAGAGSVIHLAALLHVANPPPELDREYERVNVLGTQTVCTAAAKTGVRPVVFASTITVYGPTNGRVVDEDGAAHPLTRYAETKLAGERIALACCNDQGEALTCVLRLGAIYGPAMKGNYWRLLQSLNAGRYLRVGDGNNRRTLVYESDAAAAVLAALRHPAATGSIFNVTDGDTPTMNAIVATICQALGRDTPRVAVPAGPMRLAAGLVDGGAGIFKLQSPVTRETIDRLCEDVAIDGSRLQSTLGFRPQYGLERGWRETVKSLRLRGEL